MSIIVNSDFLTDFQKDYLATNITAWNALPLYRSENSCANDGVNRLSHNLIQRPDNEDVIPTPEWNGVETRVQSEHTFIFLDMLRHLIEANGENFEDFEVLRMIINVAYRTSEEEDARGKMHADHNVDYRQVIMTLNEEFTGGGTFVDNGEGGVILPPIKNTAYMFDSQKHCSILPNTGLRMLWVATCRKIK